MQSKVIYQDEQDIKALTGEIISENTNGFLVIQQHKRIVKIPIARIVKIEEDIK